MPRRALALVVVCAFTFAAPASALAGSDGAGQGAGGAKSRILIKELGSSGARGTVSSSKSRCESDRRVQLFRLDDFVSVKIEITRTNGRGKWKTKKDLQPGEYFAKVDSVPGCRYDVSKTKRL